MTSPTRPPRHWVIGDVHGCADALAALLERLPPDDRLVFCGDVINRGPAIAATMRRVWGLVRTGRAVWLQGNHERDLVDALRASTHTGRGRLGRSATFRQLGEEGCRAWLDRLGELPLAYWGEGWVATHAGFDPFSWRPHLAIRGPFWQAYDGRFGDVVVGHTPVPQVCRRDRIVMIDTGACYGGPLTAYCPETGECRQVAGAGSTPHPGLGTRRSCTPC